MKINDKELKKIAKAIGIDMKKVSLPSLKEGYKVELEHGKVSSKTNVTDNDPTKTMKIVAAHLKESKDYYSKLAKMEKTFKNKKIKKKH